MSGPRPLILYVDDERPNRIVFEQSFNNEFNIKCAPDGPSALEILGQHEVAVLVTDMRMPLMTGDQLLRVVKEKWPTTVRMVITAFTDIEPILTAINEGLVARYVIKPWSHDELSQLLRWGIEAWTFGQQSAAVQRRLIETERLTTLGQVAGAAIHDLNQPLAGLVINADRLLEVAEATAPIRRLLAGELLSRQDRELIDELAGELGALAADIQQNAVHLRNVTAGLAQFLYKGNETPASLETDPMPIIRSAMAICHDIAIRARGLIVYEGAAELPPVRMAATELTQVLINLVANASQALLASGRTGGRVAIAARREEPMLILKVKDDGVGMPPEVLARVGTPFFTTRREGIGLGLAQCQRLVGKAGGTFRIDSEAQIGTTVTVSLPLA